MKKKSLLKKLLAVSLIATVSMTGLFACSGPTASAGNTQPSITMPGQTLEVSRYSTTFNQEANTIDIELNATVYPLTLSPVLNWSFESATGGVFDNGTSVNDVAEIIPSGSSAVVKVKRAFLGGTITVKCETTGLFNNVSGVTEIEYQGLPTSLKLSINGNEGDITEPLLLDGSDHAMRQVNITLDNFFHVVGERDTIENYNGLTRKIIAGSGTIKVTSTIQIGNKRDVKTFNISSSNPDGSMIDGYENGISFEHTNDGTFTEAEFSALPTYGYYELLWDSYDGGDETFHLVSLLEAIGDSEAMFSVGDPSRVIEFEGGTHTISFDLSDITFELWFGYVVNNVSIVSDSLYFKLLPTATGLEIAGGKVII